MFAGYYTDYIKIFEQKEVVNEFGESDLSYHFVMQTRANVIDKTMSRAENTNEIYYTKTKVFTVHYYVPINNTTQIEYQNEKYRIISFFKRRQSNDIQIITELINV